MRLLADESEVCEAPDSTCGRDGREGWGATSCFGLRADADADALLDALLSLRCAFLPSFDPSVGL